MSWHSHCLALSARLLRDELDRGTKSISQSHNVCDGPTIRVRLLLTFFQRGCSCAPCTYALVIITLWLALHYRTSSMIKMLYWLCREAMVPPNWQQVLHVIKRNFEGFQQVETLKIFEEHIHLHTYPETITEEVSKWINLLQITDISVMSTSV